MTLGVLGDDSTETLTVLSRKESHLTVKGILMLVT